MMNGKFLMRENHGIINRCGALESRDKQSI